MADLGLVSVLLYMKKTSTHALQKHFPLDGRMREAQFVWLLKKLGVSNFDAVLRDVQAAIARFTSIEGESRGGSTGVWSAVSI